MGLVAATERVVVLLPTGCLAVAAEKMESLLQTCCVLRRGAMRRQALSRVSSASYQLRIASENNCPTWHVFSAFLLTD